MRKSLGDLKILSYLIPISLILLFLASGTTLYYKEKKFPIPWTPKGEVGIISSVAIMCMSSFWHLNLFGLYKSMEGQSTTKFMALVPLQCFCCCLLSITIAIICCKNFGPELEASVLLNFEATPGVLSIALRSSFTFFIILQTPYLMLPLKQSCLVLIEEVFYSKVSQKLLINERS